VWDKVHQVVSAAAGCWLQEVCSASPQSGINPSLCIALMCEAIRWIPASASAHQGPEKVELVLLGGVGLPRVDA